MTWIDSSESLCLHSSEDRRLRVWDTRQVAVAVCFPEQSNIHVSHAFVDLVEGHASKTISSSFPLYSVVP